MNTTNKEAEKKNREISGASASSSALCPSSSDSQYDLAGALSPMANARILLLSRRIASSPRAQVLEVPVENLQHRIPFEQNRATRALGATETGRAEMLPALPPELPADFKTAHALLRHAHQLHMINPDDWSLAFSPSATEASATEPTELPAEVIIIEVESSEDMGRSLELCREIRAHAQGKDLAVLLSLPRQGGAAVARRVLDEPAIDGVLSPTASEGEIMMRVRSAAMMAFLRTQLGKSKSEIANLKQTDDLTKVFNRRFFFREAHREIERARRYKHHLACLMINIKNFSQIRRTYGSECADAALCVVADILRTKTRSSDVVARFNEDKFVLLLPETSVTNAMTLRDILQTRVRNADFHWDDEKINLEIVVGEAGRAPLTADGEAQEAGLDAHEFSLSLREAVADLLEAADAALYVAKRGARYSQSEQEAMMQSYDMETLPPSDDNPAAH